MCLAEYDLALPQRPVPSLVQVCNVHSIASSRPLHLHHDACRLSLSPCLSSPPHEVISIKGLDASPHLLSSLLLLHDDYFLLNGSPKVPHFLFVKPDSNPVDSALVLKEPIRICVDHEVRDIEFICPIAHLRDMQIPHAIARDLA